MRSDKPTTDPSKLLTSIRWRPLDPPNMRGTLGHWDSESGPAAPLVRATTEPEAEATDE